MAALPETVIMAMFCDFENVALGVRDAKYEKFDIKPVLERLLLKGSIVVKKAYCDWDRYKGFKSTMHEANFELIEIPHVRQSGKNSADIRMVVDALDLCYTKAHVNTFVVVSGDSDFSPLVSKLRENAKYVIGVGVKQSTSDLLIANCDEFIFYDDLVRESQRSVAKRDPRAATLPRLSREELDKRRGEAVELAVQTFDALVSERGDSSKIWASMLKEAIKRRKPGFNEGYYGFRTFGTLLEEAQARGFLEMGRDEKSGAYVSRMSTSAIEISNELIAGNDDNVTEGVISYAEEATSVVEPLAAGNAVEEGENLSAPPTKPAAKRRTRGRPQKTSRNKKTEKDVASEVLDADALIGQQSAPEGRGERAADVGEPKATETPVVESMAVKDEAAVKEAVAATSDQPKKPAAKKKTTRPRRPRKNTGKEGESAPPSLAQEPPSGEV